MTREILYNSDMEIQSVTYSQECKHQMSYFTMKEAGPEAARISLTTLSWATPHSANSVGKAQKTGGKQPLPERPTWVTQQPRNARRRASVESSCLEL